MTTDLKQPQLFLDNACIADSYRVRRTWHQATKYPHPLLTADRPWETGATVAYGTVLRWRDRFRMWYMVWSKGQNPGVCYAESADGIHWEKPLSDAHAFNGQRETNIVIPPSQPDALIDDISVIDDAQDAEWPLKALYWDSGGSKKSGQGYSAARSRDGVQWEKLGCVLPRWGDRFNAVSTRLDGRFALLCRIPDMMQQNKGRTVAWITSPDLRRWTKPRLILANDIEDPEALQMYSATAFPYAGLLVGSLERMRFSPDQVDVEIIFSRDAKNWQRSRTAHSFIPMGAPGHWDDRWVNLTSNAPIANDRTLWFFYSGRTGAHGITFPHNAGGVGLATLRTDGFCSAHAGEFPGWLLTPPMIWPAADLMVNADTRRDLQAHPTEASCGELRVEVRDAQNHPIKGFTADDCLPIRRNTVGWTDSLAPVYWTERRNSLRQLKGRRIRLHFVMRETHLYSFKAGDAPG